MRARKLDKETEKVKLPLLTMIVRPVCVCLRSGLRALRKLAVRAHGDWSSVAVSRSVCFFARISMEQFLGVFIPAANVQWSIDGPGVQGAIMCG